MSFCSVLEGDRTTKAFIVSEPELYIYVPIYWLHVLDMHLCQIDGVLCPVCFHQHSQSQCACKVHGILCKLAEVMHVIDVFATFCVIPLIFLCIWEHLLNWLYYGLWMWRWIGRPEEFLHGLTRRKLCSSWVIWTMKNAGLNTAFHM